MELSANAFGRHVAELLAEVCQEVFERLARERIDVPPFAAGGRPLHVVVRPALGHGVDLDWFFERLDHPFCRLAPALEIDHLAVRAVGDQRLHVLR